MFEFSGNPLSEFSGGGAGEGVGLKIHMKCWPYNPDQTVFSIFKLLFSVHQIKKLSLKPTPPPPSVHPCLRLMISWKIWTIPKETWNFGPVTKAGYC